MNTVVILGAGASRGYSGSRAGIHPPLATNFFSTFANLMISRDFEVKIGDIVNYIRDTRGIPPERQPVDFDENIEVVFAELDSQLRKQWATPINRADDARAFAARLSLSRAYDQFLFWFAHVLNEVQNGEPCAIYTRLVTRLSPDDTLVTFNWDTILDRVLYETGKWFPDDGYHVQFDGFLHNEWRRPRSSTSRYRLLKLHGSTNWFGPYVTRNLQTGERQWIATDETVNRHWCLVDGSAHFESYKDRWRPGYAPFSYFFPPNDPVIDRPLMPIMIPPTDVKLFGEYASLFNPIWSEAHTQLRNADRLLVIGYSFPATDTHAYELLDSFVAHRHDKTVELIDPYGDALLERVVRYIGGRAQVVLHKSTLAEYLGLPKIALDPKDSELARYDRGEDTPVNEEHETNTSIEADRLNYLVRLLTHLSITGQPFDLTTYGKQRFLDATLVGEFAMHLEGGYRSETLSYRLASIKIKTPDGTEDSVGLKDIWIVNPVPIGGISQEMMAEVKLDKAPPDLRVMIYKSFHCENDQEADFFLRRYLAS